MASLRNLRSLRSALLKARRLFLKARYGVDLHPSSALSLSARIISGGRNSISIGSHTLVAFNTVISSRSRDGSPRNVTIGNNCFVGGGSTILPGVRIGDHSIVGAGTVVFEDVPPNCLVAGNPGRVIRSDLQTGAYGRLPEADSNVHRYLHGEGQD